MSRKFNIKIKKPCSEKFDLFQKTNSGGFCNSCEKEVVDFTRMGDEEIINYFKKIKTITCGRFNERQLKVYSEVVPSEVGCRSSLLNLSLMGFSLFSLLPITSIGQVQHQEKIISVPIEQKVSENEHSIDAKESLEKYLTEGVVWDEENEPLIGASVVLKGASVGVLTDINGKFKFPQTLKAGDVLIFSYIGYSIQEFVIKDGVPSILNVKMKYDRNVVLMGEVAVNRLYASKLTFWQRFKGLF